MTPFLDSWLELAAPILEQALQTTVVLTPGVEAPGGAIFLVFAAEIRGNLEGRFLVKVCKQSLESLPRLDPDAALTQWPQFFERIATAVAGQLSSQCGSGLEPSTTEDPNTTTLEGVPFLLTIGEQQIPLLLVDATKYKSPPSRREENEKDAADSAAPSLPARAAVEKPAAARGMDLLLDVELEASLRFGSREMPLSEVMELGPGDVVQLDRHVADPVDLIVGDKIVARGEVVLVNGNFGLRITEVAEPQRRLESIRCLF